MLIIPTPNDKTPHQCGVSEKQGGPQLRIFYKQ